MADLLVVGSTPEFAARCASLLRGDGADVGEVRTWPAGQDERVRLLLDVCASEDPAVVVVGDVGGTNEATALTAEFERARPSSRLLLLTDDPEGLRIGRRPAIEVVDVASDDAELRAILEANLGAARFVRARLAAESERLGRLIVVVSPKGGSGKTMLSTSFSEALQSLGAGSIVLVDLDLQFGDTATALQLRPEYSMFDIAKTTGDLDATAVKVFLTPHPSGIFLLAAPDNPADGDRITVERTIEVLEVLRRAFDFVVVDTGAGVDEHALAAIERADDVLALCSMDVASTSSLVKELRILDRLGYTAGRRHLVVNKVAPGLGLRLEDIEELFGMRSEATIVAAPGVAAAMNRGETPVAAEPRSKPAREILALAQGFVAAPDATKRRGWGR